MALWNNNAYAKLGYDITDRTKVELSLDYIQYRVHGGFFAFYDETYKYNGGYMHAVMAVTSAAHKRSQFRPFNKDKQTTVHNKSFHSEHR